MLLLASGTYVHAKHGKGKEEKSKGTGQTAAMRKLVI